MCELEIYVIVDEGGSYVAHEDLAECHERANDSSLEITRRVIRVVLNVPKPEPVTVEATLSAKSSSVYQASTRALQDAQDEIDHIRK